MQQEIVGAGRELNQLIGHSDVPSDASRRSIQSLSLVDGGRTIRSHDQRRALSRQRHSSDPFEACLREADLMAAVLDDLG